MDVQKIVLHLADEINRTIKERDKLNEEILCMQQALALLEAKAPAVATVGKAEPAFPKKQNRTYKKRKPKTKAEAFRGRHLPWKPGPRAAPHTQLIYDYMGGGMPCTEVEITKYLHRNGYPHVTQTTVHYTLAQMRVTGRIVNENGTLRRKFMKRPTAAPNTPESTAYALAEAAANGKLVEDAPDRYHLPSTLQRGQ